VTVSDIAYRPARLDDAGEIHALLLRLAADMPLLVDTLEREEALYALVRNCARSGESWTACEAAGRIVGAALVEPNQRGRHYAENEMLDLRCAAVLPECRDSGVLPVLIGRVTARLTPVMARVGAQNRTGLAACLGELGFRLTGTAGGEQGWRWEPGAASPPGPAERR
jgi:N-acetylglutamate synthase-like GNAT family acetyltransferase